MIVPTTNYYFPEVIRGASQAARELNCRLVVGATNYSADEELRQARRLVGAGVDALMITPHDMSTDVSELRDFLESSRVPVVLVERGVEESRAGRLEWVRSDHVHGAEIAVRHLSEQGHHRIALAARPAATVGSLQEGFERAVGRLGAAGHGLFRNLAMPGAGDNVTLGDIDALLDECIDQGITAAIILGDTDSMALTDRAIERGLRIPEDFAVIAYDDEVSAFAAVPLTAIAPPKRELGHAALRLCFDRLAQAADAPHTIVRMILLPALVVRDSTVRAS
ncbi:LacI family DNA-binding transcriptional regulator [Microbacterium lacus]|uniref:LacI family DNA-binding transcriptional regulator n=1 Tax=Microbacterium lacus TaxID=415217 RepID=UPI00384E9195